MRVRAGRKQHSAAMTARFGTAAGMTLFRPTRNRERRRAKTPPAHRASFGRARQRKTHRAARPSGGQHEPTTVPLQIAEPFRYTVAFSPVGMNDPQVSAHALSAPPTGT
jgi:hypothetical protein